MNDDTTRPLPRCLVLMAAYNGSSYISEQLASLKWQKNVEIHVVVSVDRSTDGTEDLLDALASQDPSIRTLPHGRTFGGAAPNFMRLLGETDISGFDYIALADQDDVWLPEKIANAIDQLTAHDASCFSSDVIAWEPTGPSFKLLRKSAPQTALDHLFSSPGPGCSMVFDAAFVEQFQAWLSANPGVERRIDYHDWLIYAWARENGYKWVIGQTPDMLYRQHANNQIGANVGWQAYRARLISVRSGWYRRQVLEVARAVGATEKLPGAITNKSHAAIMRDIALLTRTRRTKLESFGVALSLLIESGEQNR